MDQFNFIGVKKMIHQYEYLVCYADTDAGQVVHHARYYTMFERARTDLMLSLGLMTSDLQKMGFSGFVVADSQIRYKRSLHLEDKVLIKTYIDEISGSRVFFHHRIEDGDKLITDCKINLALINMEAKPVIVPESIVELLSKYKI